MDKFTMNASEHAFYQAGLASGTAAATGKIVADLKVALIGQNLGDSILTKINTVLDQSNEDITKAKQDFTRLINLALRLRKFSLPLHERLLRSLYAALAEWKV